MPTRHTAAKAFASLILGVAMQPVFAQSTVEPQHPGNPGYDALLAAAVAPVHAAFGDSVKVEVERLDRLGRWAFLQGTLRAADGGMPDYTGTPYAERAATGGMSDVYVALLQAPSPSVPPEDADSAEDRAADTEATIPPAAAAQAVSGNVSAAVSDDGAEPATPPDADAGEGAAGTAETAWTLIDHAIGPSDVAWLTWPTEHAAPRQLFGF
ncbi:hypothetical protein LDO26_11850 [Luteimonas sp. BDR2-5]|uniref:hypothetical protein n=1 Tax=Proluteimonas luteida TaxID=2878685 RepID=UPI001E4CE3AE|nr:hypothetical protein [Luteimonas sp. BDR2-5]MCD9028901.1 hypothetical protein [Luteimonas sp. BDR2-5]